jgi:hypothetical protein
MLERLLTPVVVIEQKLKFTENLVMALPSTLHEPDDIRPITESTESDEYRALILKLRWIGLEQEAVQRGAQFKSPPGESMLGGTD